MSKWMRAAILIDSEQLVLEESSQTFFVNFFGKSYVVAIPKLNSWQQKISCTCKHGSIQGMTQGALCSHKLAAIAFLVEQHRRNTL